MNSNNKYDHMAATTPGSLAEFPASRGGRTGDKTSGMGEVEHCRGEFIRPGRLSPLHEAAQQAIKMVRYRLDVGRNNQITLEELKRILIEESGVDKNNIKNINIQGDYSLVELPDEMPQDIFLHLKSVEIKQHKLDIKRVKARNNKRGNNRGRRAGQRPPQSVNGDNDHVIDS
jgi:hypothetical protein